MGLTDNFAFTDHADTWQNPNSTQNAARGRNYAPVDLDTVPSEEEEDEIYRQNLIREQEGNGAHLDRRLLAPPNEVQRRNTVPKKQQIDLLRKKQLELVDLQIDLNKILVDTAKVVQEKERILLTQAKGNSAVNVDTNFSIE